MSNPERERKHGEMCRREKSEGISAQELGGFCTKVKGFTGRRARQGECDSWLKWCAAGRGNAHDWRGDTVRNAAQCRIATLYCACETQSPCTPFSATRTLQGAGWWESGEGGLGFLQLLRQLCGRFVVPCKGGNE